MKSLNDMAGVRKKGVISEWYAKGWVLNEDLSTYARAIEIYKEKQNATLEDWLKLKRNGSMYGIDRSKCKMFWIDIAIDEKAMKKARKNYEIYKNENPDEEHEDFDDCCDDIKEWFQDHTYFPSCAHCCVYFGDEVLRRGYTCSSCWKHVCRNCSWDKCRFESESESDSKN